CAVANLIGNLLHPLTIEAVLFCRALPARRHVHGHRKLVAFDEANEHLAIVFRLNDAGCHIGFLVSWGQAVRQQRTEPSFCLRVTNLQPSRALALDALGTRRDLSSDGTEKLSPTSISLNGYF